MFEIFHLKCRKYKKEMNMSMSNASFVVTWGTLISGIGILFVVLTIWCHDANVKLRYILELLRRIERGMNPAITTDSRPSELPLNVVAGKPIPTIMTVCIIGLSVGVFFILPIWLLNR